MLGISDKELKIQARQRGYRPEILEKVYRLLDLLEQFTSVPTLKQSLALKGGTAINLFCAKQLPRLSVDIDFNYIGALDRPTMLADRPKIEAIILDICRRRRYSLHRNPRAHAGGKMVLVYDSLLGNKGRLEVDLNYMFRVPLFDLVVGQSAPWPKSVSVPMLEIHELAAGKLHALLGRDASRDLFDSHQILTHWQLDSEKLRLAFVVYAGMERDHWQRIGVDNIKFSVKDIQDKLVPVLHNSVISKNAPKALMSWAKSIVNACIAGFDKILPFKDNEVEFLSRLQDKGEICPELICNDELVCQRVKKHPLLLWRAKSVASR